MYLVIVVFHLHAFEILFAVYMQWFREIRFLKENDQFYPVLQNHTAIPSARELEGKQGVSVNTRKNIAKE